MYSPSDSPAAATIGVSDARMSGATPHLAASPAQHATDVTKIAGCETSVRLSVSPGPSKHSVESGAPTCADHW